MSKSAPSRSLFPPSIDYTVKRAGVFALQVALPAGYTLDSVQGDNILQWQPRDAAAGAGQVLDVSFKNRLLGAYSLRLELVRPHPTLPPTVAIPGVHPLDVQKLSGSITVAAEPGVAAKTTNFDGLTEIPGASLGSGANTAAGVLAYKFLSAQPGPLPEWKLDVACEKIDPWVRVEIAQITSISDNLLNGLAIVRYDIQNAPVKEFRFKIPAAYTNIEFNCPNLRRRDQNTTNGEWSVELQNAVFGQFQFQITWEKPVDLKTNTLDLPPIQALGVERESGFVVVSGKKALQVAEQSSSGELMKIDASELPDWVSGAQGPGADLALHPARLQFERPRRTLCRCRRSPGPGRASDPDLGRGRRRPEHDRNAAGGAQQRLAGFGSRTAGRTRRSGRPLSAARPSVPPRAARASCCCRWRPRTPPPTRRSRWN